MEIDATSCVWELVAIGNWFGSISVVGKSPPPRASPTWGRAASWENLLSYSTSGSPALKWDLRARCMKKTRNSRCIIEGI